MKYILSGIFIILSTLSQAQNLKATVRTTEPRIGSKFGITIRTTFLDSIMPDRLLDSGFQFGRYAPGFPSVFYKSIELLDTGWIEYGPFSFEHDGIKYNTNSIRIHIINGLGRKQGMWIRHFQNDGNDYIIVEQQQKTRLKLYPNLDGVKLHRDSINGIKLEAREYLRSGTSQDQTTGRIKYTFAIYLVKRDRSFKGPLIITKDHFRKLPEYVNGLPLMIE